MDARWLERRLGIGTPAHFVDVEDGLQTGALRRLTFRTAQGVSVPALYQPPARSPGPVILYCHAHGNRYDIGMAELTDGRPALLSPYLGPLTDAGYGVLCLDMPCFGARADETESARAKALLWHGRTLFGQMLEEQSAGLKWLRARPEVDPARIAAMGISMGGTLAWWLAAFDGQLRAAVSMCCFADLATLIETGAHDGHGIYMMVPGLLADISTGQVAGLAAPTPMLHCVGFADWSTPRPAFETARADLEAAYGTARDALRFHIAEEPGHEETPAMRTDVLSFLARHLLKA